MLVGAEAHEHRPVLGHSPIGHVAPEDLPEPLLIRAPDMRLWCSVVEFHTIELGSTNHLLLSENWKRLPRDCVVTPLLE